MAGTNRSQAPVLGGPRVILVEPQLGENIGAAARAMLNCGLTDMALVAPREPWPNEKARRMSAGATAVLEAAQLFETVDEATAGLQRIYAATARPRDITIRVATPRAAAADMRRAHAAGTRIGILFGPERSGLTNDHLVLADMAITAPLNPAYASLNLAQAVLLVGYEWYQAADDTAAMALHAVASEPATKQQLMAFLARLEHELDGTNYFRVAEARPSAVRKLRSIFQRAALTEQDVGILQGVVSALRESWREMKARRGGG